MLLGGGTFLGRTFLEGTFLYFWRHFCIFVLFVSNSEGWPGVLFCVQIFPVFSYFSVTAALHSAVQFRTVLHCAVLNSTVLHSALQLRTVLHCALLNSTALHSTLQLRNVLHCAVLNSTVLHSALQLITVLHCAVLNRKVLHSALQFRTVLHCAVECSRKHHL